MVELNPRLLQEYQILIISELSLQALFLVFVPKKLGSNNCIQSLDVAIVSV